MNEQMNECLKKKNRKQKEPAPLGKFTQKIPNVEMLVTVDDVCMKLYCHTDIKYNQSHPKRQYQSIDDQSVIKMYHTFLYTLQMIKMPCYILYEVNISVSVIYLKSHLIC